MTQTSTNAAPFTSYPNLAALYRAGLSLLSVTLSRDEVRIIYAAGSKINQRHIRRVSRVINTVLLVGIFAPLPIAIVLTPFVSVWQPSFLAALVISAVFVSVCLGVVSYGYTTHELVQKYLGKWESLFTLGMSTFPSVGSAPAILLASDYGSVRRLVDPHLDARGLLERDADVIAVLLNDGYDGTIDEVLATARSLR